ncbi:hypothetical protein COX25_03905, partial [bacterium (Candidatus Howlettbacteria) CG23_combo_of_CG06-09_8_20_14_all_37_9]
MKQRQTKLNKLLKLTLLSGAFAFFAFLPGKAFAACTGDPINDSGCANSGNFISSVKNTGWPTSFTTLNWTPVTPPASTGITMRVRAGNTATPDGTWTDWLGSDGTNATNLSNGGSLAFLGQKQYIQYKAYLYSTDVNVAPTLTNVTLSYRSAGFLNSSPYNINADDAHPLTPLTWVQNITGNGYVGFQLRTSPDNSNWTAWMGPDGTVNTFFEDPGGSGAVPNVLQTGNNDRWVQYRILLKSNDGVGTASVSSISLSYAAMVPTITSSSPTASTG